jgi:ribosome biogenesis protein UTP30
MYPRSLLQVIALKKTPQGRGKDKPIRISIPHPLYNFDGAEVCLIVKDHKGMAHCSHCSS